MLHEVDSAVYDFAEVMRGDICSHAYCYTDRSVDEQVREARGEDRRFAAGIIEVGVPLYDVLFDVAHHLAGKTGKSRLGITVSGRTVSVDITEVAVTLYKCIAVRERLSHTDERTINSGVSVGMVSTEHVTDGSSGLTEGFIVCEVIFIHSVEDTSLTGLHTVACVRESAGDMEYSMKDLVTSCSILIGTIF